MQAVAAARPPVPYLGGKRNLARRICARIDATPHTGYYEPFVGAGGIFLRRQCRPRAEAINDISGDVATLFRILQHHYEAFIGEMRWKLSSRAEFERLMRQDVATLTDIERAARFLYLQRLAFGGKIAGRNFGVDARTPARFDMSRLEQDLAEVHERLQPVVIEQLPYADFIRRYDHAGALFYLDPPYWGGEADYGVGVFERADFERIANQLAGIAGKFILSINGTEGAREVFGRFHIEEVDTTWTIATAAVGKGKKVTELLVRNFA